MVFLFLCVVQSEKAAGGRSVGPDDEENGYRAFIGK